MTHENKTIRSPQDPQLHQLCDALRSLGDSIHRSDSQQLGWPDEQLELVAQHGVYHWFVPKELGGLGWSPREIVEGYQQLSAACLTTAFIITQRVAAIKRIAVSENTQLREQLIPEILDGSTAATVGISHLTTSRRHTGQPALAAQQTESGFELNGFSPWVTGACGADIIVVGAELADGRQILLALPKNTAGVTVEPGFSLVALSASQTGAVRCDQVSIGAEWLIAGPIENVLTTGSLSATGGFQTSSLATGLTRAAVDFIGEEAERRPDLLDTHHSLHEQLAALTENLLEVASGNPVCSNEELRTEANSLVLRATQASLVAAKGTGFVTGHRVGRWCQEALFFLVWSCPQAVANANLCELAGIGES